MATILERKQNLLKRLPNDYHREHILSYIGYPELLSEPRLIEYAHSQGHASVEDLTEEGIGEFIEAWAKEVDLENDPTSSITIPSRVFIDECSRIGLCFDKNWENLLISENHVKSMDLQETLLWYGVTRCISGGTLPSLDVIPFMLQYYIVNFDFVLKQYQIASAWMQNLLVFSYHKLVDESVIKDYLVHSIPWIYRKKLLRHELNWAERDSTLYPDKWETEFTKYNCKVLSQCVPTWSEQYKV